MVTPWAHLSYSFSLFLSSSYREYWDSGFRAHRLATTVGGRGVDVLWGFCGLSLDRYDFGFFVHLAFVFPHKGFI